ncbi:hypothetical protein GXW82_43100 [Streptacidiphilus sp. 4-A2]|nr:hypothetical protein [Streptacidiphilus sp. 4-A2]
MSTETLPAQTHTRTPDTVTAEHPADDTRGTRTGLIGRRRELDDIAALLDGRGPYGQVLLLRGTRGSGSPRC